MNRSLSTSCLTSSKHLFDLLLLKYFCPQAPSQKTGAEEQKCVFFGRKLGLIGFVFYWFIVHGSLFIVLCFNRSYVDFVFSEIGFVLGLFLLALFIVICS